jgi:ABC-type glycerol-3-phosphate transport system permease component
MRLLRRIHLYLGCFFAPLLIFYVATGWYQTVHPDRRKGLNDSNDWISRLSRVHVEQYYPTQSATGYSTYLFRSLVVAMAAALIATVCLGILLAFRSSRKKWPVWLALVLGVVLPIAMLWLGQQYHPP